MPLTNRTALVTGASRGIGAAIALALAEAGANVAINYRDRAHEATSVADAIKAMVATPSPSPPTCPAQPPSPR